MHLGYLFGLSPLKKTIFIITAKFKQVSNKAIRKRLWWKKYSYDKLYLHSEVSCTIFDDSVLIFLLYSSSSCSWRLRREAELLPLFGVDFIGKLSLVRKKNFSSIFLENFICNTFSFSYLTLKNSTFQFPHLLRLL